MFISLFSSLHTAVGGGLEKLLLGREDAFRINFLTDIHFGVPASFEYILCSSNSLLFSLSLFPQILHHSFLSSFLPAITFLTAFLSSFLPTFVPIFFLYLYFYLLSLISHLLICLQFISEMICCGRLARRDQIYEFVRCTLMYVQHPLQKVRSRLHSYNI